MDLNLDADQQQLVQVARDYVARHYEVSNQARFTNDGTAGRNVLAELAKLGWVGMSVAEDAGGAGATLVETCLVLEELGRNAVESPLIGAEICAGLLIDAAEEGIPPVLEQIFAGSHIVALVNSVPGTGRLTDQGPATGKRADGGWEISGAFDLVSYAHEADSILCVAELEGRGPALLHVDLPDERIETRRQRVIGGEARAKVLFDGYVAKQQHISSLQPDAVATSTAAAQLRAAVLRGAHAVGACEGAIGLSVTWAKDRHQFGRPIGSFQAVSNRCADMRIAVDAARLLTWEAAWALSTAQPDSAARVSTAKNYLNHAAEVVVTNAHQVHGAIGYSTEYPLHAFTRSLKAFQASLGSTEDHLDVVATSLGL
jgi:alkylation response protein AidB-like acyl-CoA dehydrogenase